MITTNYQQPVENSFFQSISVAAKSLISFHAYETPILQQWHQLISTIRDKANRRQWVTLINPPFIPNDAYLKEIGLGDHYVRVMRLEHNTPATSKYIQRCVQNGKSSVVAVWVSNREDLPDVLLNDSPIGCQALVFCPNMPTASSEHKQFEMAF
jgi:cell division inhibitor SulA